MQLPGVAVGLTTRLSVHLVPLSPLWTLASHILCPARLTVMPRQPLQGDQEERWVGIEARSDAEKG